VLVARVRTPEEDRVRVQGTFRYALAMLVVLGHLWPGVWDVPLAHPGVYAVFGFYLLSGYLMSLTLSRTYPFDVTGTLRFFGNRALRIYPPYLVVLAASTVAIAFAPGGALGINPFLRRPDALWGWLKNIWIFGVAGEKLRVVPPAWSLDVELCFYVAMGLLLGRQRWISALWCVASLGYTGWLLASDAAWQLRYAPVAAASLPFSLGAVLYHFGQPLRAALRRLGNRRAGTLAFSSGALFVANAVLADEIWSAPMAFGFYASLGMAAVVLTLVDALDVASLPRRVVVCDRWLGRLSYPIFLCHWLAALLSVWIVYGGRRPAEGPAVFLCAQAAVHAIALMVYLGVERPIERLRTIVRRGGPGGTRAEG